MRLSQYQAWSKFHDPETSWLPNAPRWVQYLLVRTWLQPFVADTTADVAHRSKMLAPPYLLFLTFSLTYGLVRLLVSSSVQQPVLKPLVCLGRSPASQFRECPARVILHYA